MNKNSNLKKGMFAAMLFAALQFGTTACGDSEQPNDESSNNTEQPAADNTNAAPEAPAADEGKGVGPIKEVTLTPEIDAALAEKGKATFEAKCTACHNPTEEKKVGPGLKGVTERRKPEWIMNMILNPEKMVQEDPTAKELLATYIAPMANQNLSEDEARSVLEYFRQNDKK